MEFEHAGQRRFRDRRRNISSTSPGFPPVLRARVMNVFDLSGEVAVVIGATGALGGAIAEGLAEAGAKIAVLGRNEERGQARVKAIQSKGGKAAFFNCDAVKKESLHAAHQAIEKLFGAVTILVNAAG